METTLSAREFLKRFHLPQLVRVSSVAEKADNEEESNADDSTIQSKARNATSPGHLNSNTSISSSFVALDSTKQQHEKSNWTYRPAVQAKEADEEAGQALRSLCFERNENEEEEEPEQRFRSISDWSSVQANWRQESSNQSEARKHLFSHPARSGTKKSVEFVQEASKNASSAKSASSTGASQVSTLNWSDTMQSIRLAPPSKRPALNKLQLNQPFLLYKAYKKLELCAYVIDTKNELNEKSGDPIYFPHNYPGWFCMSTKDSEVAKNGLESVEEVCQTSAQIFLTRDEIVGYQLPSKLSHLTKLKNNQLLALPLAINLDKVKSSSEEWPSVGGNSSKEQSNNISDIRQIVIQCGQVLKICGVYEDVLPLMESGASVGIVPTNNINRRSASSSIQSYHAYEQHYPGANLQYQRAAQAPAGNLYHQMAAAQLNQQQLYQVAENGFPVHGHSQANVVEPDHQQRRTRKLLKLKNTQQQSKGRHCAAGSGSYALSNPFIYDQNEPQVGAKVKLRGRQQQRPPPAIGQRYARCILLSQKSVDRFTNCLPGGQSGQLERTSDSIEEIEVLIPMEQRGRFYLCATNQSIVAELFCHGCNSNASSLVGQSSLVFRLSQIVSLLNLSRRLAMKNRELMRQHQRQPLNQRFQAQAQAQLPTLVQELVKLPLNVQLVVGSRPANFSPTMFGSSSTMESYFAQEANVGGHFIQCNYNKNHPSSPDKLLKQDNNGNLEQNNLLSGPVCGCALSLAKPSFESSESYGIFSASLRIERVMKRDVLLACTIKKDPLLKLDLFGMENCSSTGQNQTQAQNNSSHKKKGQLASSTITITGEPTKGGSIIGDFGLTGSADRMNHSKKLISLRENNNRCDKQDSKSIGKSSFSRLRACRSLISLNGRRKRRPNIPSSMLSVEKHLSSDLGDCNSPGGATGGQLSKLAKEASFQSGQSEPIVMLEFDCNEQGLQFARTFVESSIPTSTIPDLVLKRMEFCHRNSSDWERQLKLSQRSLAQDFDSCQLQLKQSRQQQLQLQLNSIQQQQMSSIHSSRSKFETTSQRQENLSAFRDDPSLVHSTTGSSSSRSSSGVSSANGRANLLNLNGSQVTTCSSTRSSSAKNNTNCSPPGSLAATTTTAASKEQNSSRLLRLVHRMLPPLSRLSAGSTTRNEQQMLAVEAYERQRKVMCELNGRFKRELVVDCATYVEETTELSSSVGSGQSSLAGRSSCEEKTFVGPTASARKNLRGGTDEKDGFERKQTEKKEKKKAPKKEAPSSSSPVPAATCPSSASTLAQVQLDDATLMNAQKIHRKLMMSRAELGARHLAANTRTSLEDQNHFKLAGGSVRVRGLNGGTLNDASRAQDSEDSGSHLYESLERLNEGINKKRQLAAANVAPSENASASASLSMLNQVSRVQNRTNSGQVETGLGLKGRNRNSRARLRLGKSIEFLVGGSSRVTALVGREAQLQQQQQQQRQRLFEDTDDECECEDDDSGDWWQRSTREESTSDKAGKLSERCTLRQLGHCNDSVLIGQQEQQQQQQQEQQLKHHRQANRNLHEVTKAAGERNRSAWLSSDSSNGCAMEPVSIEACSDQFVSAVDSDNGTNTSSNSNSNSNGGDSSDADSDHKGRLANLPDQTSSRSASSYRNSARSERAIHCLRSLIDRQEDQIGQFRGLRKEEGERGRKKEGENIYVNLSVVAQAHSRSALELAKVEEKELINKQAGRSSSKLLASRMERKLAKIRAKHRNSREGEVEDWRSERDLRFLARDGRDEPEVELEQHSINLPCADFAIEDQWLSLNEKESPFASINMRVDLAQKRLSKEELQQGRLGSRKSARKSSPEEGAQASVGRSPDKSSSLPSASSLELPSESGSSSSLETPQGTMEGELELHSKEANRKQHLSEKWKKKPFRGPINELAVDERNSSSSRSLSLSALSSAVSSLSNSAGCSEGAFGALSLSTSTSSSSSSSSATPTSPSSSSPPSTGSCGNSNSRAWTSKQSKVLLSSQPNRKQSTNSNSNSNSKSRYRSQFAVGQVTNVGSTRVLELDMVKRSEQSKQCCNGKAKLCLSSKASQNLASSPASSYPGPTVTTSHVGGSRLATLDRARA